MLTKNKIKLIESLSSKKGRKENGVFIVEGEKMVAEVLTSDLEVVEIYGLYSWWKKNKIKDFSGAKEVVTEKELKKISGLTTPNSVVCVVRIPENDFSVKNIGSGFVLALDNLQDPGNLGTIIRTADWFGVKNIFCSKNCVDVYNPKVVQSTMGAISRVKVYYTDLSELILEIKKQDKKYPVYGAFMVGKNIFAEKIKGKGMFVFGNESQGISKELEKTIDKKITIPRDKESKMESLNVAVAAGVILGITSL